MVNPFWPGAANRRNWASATLIRLGVSARVVRQFDRVRVVVGHSGGISALALTGARVRRLESGK